MSWKPEEGPGCGPKESEEGREGSVLGLLNPEKKEGLFITILELGGKLVRLLIKYLETKGRLKGKRLHEKGLVRP